MPLIESIKNRFSKVERPPQPPMSTWTLEQTAQNLELLQNQLVNLRSVLENGNRPSHFHYFMDEQEPTELSQRIEELYEKCVNKEDFLLTHSPESNEANKLYYEYFKNQGLVTFPVITHPPDDQLHPGEVAVFNREKNLPIDTVTKLFRYVDFQLDTGFKTIDIKLDIFTLNINATRENESFYRLVIPVKDSVTSDLHQADEDLRERHVLLGRKPKTYWSTFSILKKDEKLISDMLAARV